MTENKDTNESYLEVIGACKRIFLQKSKDYGTSWRIMRLTSVTDQIFIKAERIRNIQESRVNIVGDSIESEFMGIINYAVIALIIHSWKNKEHPGPEVLDEELENLYDHQINLSFETMKKKNHDYDEAWRKMRISSMTDLILMKLLRLKQIEDNDGKTKVSEGVDANYIDIINYAVFALIRRNETKKDV